MLIGDHVLASAGDLLRRVAAAELLPRLGRLGSSEVHGKPSEGDPTDIVTAADLAVEAWLAPRLAELVPGSSVVGEEHASIDPAASAAAMRSPTTWYVDPLDGTRQFARGEGPFGTMIALVHEGEPVLAAIYLPLVDRLYTAVAGRGASVNDRPIVPGVRARPELTGTLYTKFMEPSVGAVLESRACSAAQSGGLALRTPVMCAAHQYAELIEGRQDFAVYHRLLPWDHAPGVLLLRESGGSARHADGRDYRVDDRVGPALVTRHAEDWSAVRAILFPSAPPRQ
jgi:fructose-1,6-bisphosphatase/inositol monophosphatase family enzyme